MSQDTLPYGPKLRKVIAQIQELMIKENVVGFVTLHDQTHGEFLCQLEASWSLIEFKPNNDGTALVRFKMRPKQQDDLNSTTAFIYSSRDMMAMWFDQLNKMAKAVEQHATVEHKPIFDRIHTKDKDGDIN